jgi:hypothetical protein
MPRVFRQGGVTLYPNWRLGTDLRRSHAFDAVLDRLAQEAASASQAIAAREFYDTGDYLRSIDAGVGPNRRGAVVGRVVAGDFKAVWAERGWTTQGGRKVAGRKILARGARRAGLRVRAPRRRA